MRETFYDVMRKLIEKDKSVYIVNPDFGIPHSVREQYGNNLIDTGLTEQATVGMASGMALYGLKPWVVAITPFILERTFEQIKLDVVSQNSNVKLVGYWNYPSAGLTHEAKDVRGLCEIAGIKLFNPHNKVEARKMLMAGYQTEEPAFYNLTKDRNAR